MFTRLIQPQLEEALGDSPVVLIHGARQTGKSTLAHSVATAGASVRRYVTFDDAVAQAAARADPAGFVGALDGPVTLDEVQRVPELFPAIKLAVDEDRRPGRFLLTGSANVLTLPKIAESLAGRLEIVSLWPLSVSERLGVRRNFVDAVLGAAPRVVTDSDEDVWDHVLAGGYPEVVARAAPRRRAAWFGSYLTTILQRDVREIANIENLHAMPRLLALLASRIGGLLNLTDVASSLAMPLSTLKRYVALLEATFLVRPLPAWSTNRGLRLIKSPKLFLVDTGLATHLLGIDRQRLERDGPSRGALLENFVVLELSKLAGASEARPALFHFRTTTGREVDVVLERPNGDLVGLEVKASATVRPNDFKGLTRLREVAGDRFHRGIVLYTGSQVVPFGDELWAVPIQALWG